MDCRNKSDSAVCDCQLRFGGGSGSLVSVPPGLIPRRRHCRGGAMVSDPEGTDPSRPFTMRRIFAANLIPAHLGASHWARRLPATGCDGSNSATRQAIGAWKAGLMLGDLVQEARSDRSRPSAGTWTCRWLLRMRSHAVACSPDDRTGARQPSTDRDTNRRTRVPEGAMGPPGPKEPARLSGGPQGLLGGGNAALGLPSTAPASRRFISADTRGARASGRNGACAVWMAGAEQAPGAQSRAERACARL